jgi:hypothetical protein
MQVTRENGFLTLVTSLVSRLCEWQGENSEVANVFVQTTGVINTGGSPSLFGKGKKSVNANVETKKSG